MNFFKEDNWIRDLLFTFILLALIHHVTSQENDTKVGVKQLAQPFITHEVDQETIARIDRLEEELTLMQQELERLKHEASEQEKAKQLENYIQEIDEIQHNVTDIKGEYQTTSPALAFLGPLGSTSIVLKEKKLEKKLLESINQAINISKIYTNTTFYKPANNLKQAELELADAISKLKTIHN